MTGLLYLVFVLSGAAGLIYESIWTRYLGLFVGHDAYAQIVVLTIFLGGMSAGAVLAGNRTARLREPLVAYAVVEALVGIIGLFFHDLYGAATQWAYDVVFPVLAGGATLAVVKWGLAALLILPQSVLLGMTFPLMSAGVMRIARGRPGRVLALLYFSNSLGAAVGVLVSGFYLLRLAGLPGTLSAAAIINLVVALVTFLGARLALAGRADAAEPVAPGSATESATPSAAPNVEPNVQRLWRLLLGVTFGTAIASFIYEISWIRMLALVLGSSTYAFELMLSAFILGLALGALWVHRRADGFRDPLRALGVVQWCMGLAALATLPVYLHAFGWTVSLLAAVSRTPQGYALFGGARYLFCLAVMLPATIFAGMTLPLITRTLVVAGKGERAIGAVYGVNTFGSIVGVALGGLVLLPWVGLKALLIAGAVLDMALGVVLLRASSGGGVRARATALVAAAGAAAAGLLAMFGTRFDAVVLSSGVYRYARIPPAGTRTALFYRDGRTATVSVVRSNVDSSIFIATNGKPDASLQPAWLTPAGARARTALDGDVSTQVLLPLVSLAHAPAARNVAVIGHGSGMTSHLLLGSPRIEHLTTVEIEPMMIAGSRVFLPTNHRVFDDPRARFVIDDAKSYFASAGQRFDLIVSEPSNPWVSGVSGLFTVEFYRRVKRYLAPDGVFAQWLHLYEMNDRLVLSVLGAVHRNFPAYAVYMTSNVDLLIIARPRPGPIVADWSVLNAPGLTGDLARVVPFAPSTLEETRLFGREAIAPLLDRLGLVNSDYFPVLDLGAERARYLGSGAVGFRDLAAGRIDPAAIIERRRIGFDTTLSPVVPGVPRMGALAIAAALRRERAGMLSDRALPVPAMLPAYARWRLESASGAAAPTDWRVWMRDAAGVEQVVHGGTAGVADEVFYDGLRRFLDAQHAPPEARAAVHFLHGIAAWEFGQAAVAADTIIPDALRDRSWLPDDELRDGATLAKLESGDVDGARRVWRTLASRSKRAPDDLRSMLIEAQLVAARAPEVAAAPRR